MAEYDFVLDMDFSILRISAEAENKLGYTPSEISGKPFIEMIKTEYRDRTVSALKTKEKDFCFILGSDDVQHFIELEPCTLPDGTTGVKTVSLNPLTKEKSGAFSCFAEFIENIYDIYYSADIYGNITAISPSVFIYSGFTPEELIGKNLGSELYVYPALRETFKELIGKHGKVTAFDAPLFRKDGSIWWVSTSAHFIKNINGEIIGVEGIARDITDHKEGQEKLLRGIETRYKTLFESATDAIFIFDLRTKRIADANAAARKMTGYSLEELRKLMPEQLHPKYEFEKIHSYIVRKREEFGLKETVRLDFLSKHGDIVPAELTASVITEDGRKFSIDVARDISQRLATEKKQREQEQMIVHQSKLAAMGEMISNIAHQWRQPLSKMTGILTNLEMGIKQGNLARDEAETLIKEAFSTLKFMSHTIDDFKNFFSPSKPVEEFCINTALDEVLSIIEPNLRFHGIRVMIKAQENVFLRTYRSEFCQVLLNIIQNAKDILYLRRIAEPKIDIRITSGRGKTVIRVADNGGGIEHAAMGRIFEPYFTTRPDGQGIGLYMSKIIIEKNIKGTITARNTFEGAEFTIVL
ncbi:PAS domain S-box protein [Geovibrio thiophilus]|uniref:histidine kinase n=1 Tax=Geovibrio thiophilus TaxID=139438 RepID=A0A3R6AZ88_9BACT|nr:PAS domain S-box protein [Geovibrio thiophilus]QAR33953.1 PAS domain S-box protein [Geovibrio thiophilus]